VNAPKPNRRLLHTRIALIALAVIVGMTAQFFRNAHVVVAPDIMRELNASAASLAALTSAMFFAAAFTQVPGGILLDRFGTRIMIPLMLVLSGIGAGLFGAAQSVGELIFARAFMGVGGTVLVMAAIVLCARWFDARHFSSLAGGIMATSQLGNLGATVPMALIASWFGWRGAYTTLLAFTLILAAIVYAVARDAPPGHEYHARLRETPAQGAAGVIEVLRILGIWRLMVMAWFAWPTSSCIVGLWAGPYLSDVYGLGTLGRGKTTVNCAVLFGAASLQASTGVIISMLSTPGEPISAQAFRVTFAALAAVLVVALACYWRCPEGQPATRHVKS